MTDLSLTITVDDDHEPSCQVAVTPDRSFDANDLLIMAEHLTRAAHFMSHVGLVNSLSDESDHAG